MKRMLLTSLFVHIFSQTIASGRLSLFTRKFHMIFYNMLTVFCFYSFLNMLFWNYEINFLITITVFYIISLVMYYVHEFRGTNVNFSDIMSIGTAREVASGYTYKIRIVFILTFAIIALLYVYHIVYIGISPFHNYHVPINGIESFNIDVYRFFWHEIGQVLSFFISFFVLRDKASNNNFDYSLLAGENEGYLYNFISSMPLFHRLQLNYKTTVFEARKFIYEIFGSVKGEKNRNQIIANSMLMKYKSYVYTNYDAPHVIVIMNESFGTIQKRIPTNIPVTPNYDSLDDVIKGNLYVNTFGGGTANTEFEFLTGMSIGNYDFPVMPYNNFVKKDKYSIARFFNNLGYKTIAMHPYTATNYNRNNVYRRFGFSERMFFDDFKAKRYLRNYVTDLSMYEEIVHRYKIAKDHNDKLFLFGVTMQNHSGYSKFNEQEISVPEGFVKNTESLNSYLSLMHISDMALGKLINYFRYENEHVLILFFGDHNASFGSNINRKIYDTNIHYECTNPYVTPLLIFDNRKLESGYIEEISANFLSLELLKCGGFPIDTLHLMLNDLYNEYSVYNYHKAKRRDNNEIVNIPIDKLYMLEKEYLR